MNSFLRLSRPLLALALAAATLPSQAQTPTERTSQRAVVSENVSKAGFADTLKALKEQLAADGWNLLAEIDLGQRLAKKNVTIPGGLVILEMTSGGNTIPLLKNEETRYVSGLMPCSVTLYGMSDGSVVISRMNAGLLTGMMEPRVAEVLGKSAAQLDTSIARTLAKLGK